MTFIDYAKPTVSSGPTQDVTANNTSNTASITVTITIAFNEYMDTTQVPTFLVINSGGDAAYVLPISAISIAWNPDGRGLLLTLSIPASTNASGDTIVIARSGCKDLSGNEMDTDTLHFIF